MVFTSCPSCGSNVKKDSSEDHCYLCKTELSETEFTSGKQEEAFRLDINTRIEDLDTSIKEHKKHLNRQKSLLIKLKTTKYDLDIRLESEVERYESLNLSSYRDIERRIATYNERIKGFERALLIPKEIHRLKKEVSEIIEEESEIKQKIEDEKSKLTKASGYIKDIEDKFLEVMLEVGLPGVNVNDEININRRTWEVSVYPHGNEHQKWSFGNAGSGGKKTLFKVCFAISLHLVAASNGLDLPKILIIDTPMKNIQRMSFQIINL